MRSLKRIGTIFIVLALLLSTQTAFAQEPIQEKPWTGALKDGTKINADDLKKILADHDKWLDTRGKEGDKANLKGANLCGANLQGADLSDADLQGAMLVGANLRGAEFTSTNFEGSRFEYANLEGAKLWNANLRYVNIRYARLQETNFWNANLYGANFYEANLYKAYLGSANLEKALFGSTNLKEAYLGSANLKGASFYHANLQGADFWESNLKEAVFEINPNNLPDIPSIATAIDLSSLKYEELPHALVELREAFKKFGLRKQERQITYAIKRSGYENALEKGNLLTKIEVFLGRVFFETTCEWGMAPERPLFILVGLIFVFTIPYTLAISGDIYGKKKTDGIWIVWIPGRMRDDLGTSHKEILDDISPRSLKYGFYFSLLSAFHFGWRDLNVGNWIARIQRYEYRLQATGWARTISGIQSLISVYLLALSVLTYFGRPFESY